MVTLDRLVNVLGSYGVRLCHCPLPRSTELRSVVIHEPAQDRVVLGDVLLAVGASSIKEAMQWAARARAVAVLIRDDGETPAAGDGDEIAVMVVDTAVSWSELAAIVYGLVLEGRETESGRGPTDLFALADSLAEATGAAVTIEDRLLRVLAYSRLHQDADPARIETILDRQAPRRLRELFESRGVFAHLVDSEEPLFVPESAEHQFTGRMVVAARAGRELLGSVWVTCTAPLDEPHRAALADGARTVALHLLRSRASADLERHVESDLVIQLLEGTADAATVTSRLGLPPTRLRVIAVRASIAAERHASLLLAFECATTGFGWSRPSRSSLMENTVYTVLPGEHADSARRWVTALRAAMPAGVTVMAGISGPGAAAELSAARREADECLALHEARSRVDDDAAAADADADADAVPAYDESWSDILLQRLRTAADSGRAPTRGPVWALRRHDQQRSTHYVATLQAWLEAQGDLPRTGQRLGVHENTVRYRLRKMAEVTLLELDDPRRRLAMMIELAATDDPSSGLSEPDKN